MKILILDQYGEFGGAQRCLFDLTQAFAREGWQVRLGIAGGGPFTEELRRHELPVDILPACRLGSGQKPVADVLRYIAWQWKAVRRVREIAAEFEPDVLYVNGPRLLPAAALLARHPRTRVLFHAHNRVMQRAAVHAVGCSLAFTRARVIACSRYVAGSLRRYVADSAVHVVYNGVPDLRTAATCRSRHVPTIGVIGRIDREKGQLEFVRAARLLFRASVDCCFVLAGAPLLGTDDRYYREVVEASRGLPITFTGWRNDIAGAFHDIDILVVPSFQNEATPRVIMEAFSAGIPVIAFASGGIPELIEDGRTGFLVYDRSPEALAKCMLELLRADSETLAGVARSGRDRWQSDFRVERYQHRVCSIVAAETANCA